MARFFDPNVRSDELLLHDSVRTNDELDDVAARVEREILRTYTQRDPVTRVREVKLEDFDADPSLCDADLAEVLKETIARVTSWRLLHKDRKERVSLEVLGSYTIAYSAGDKFDPLWPPGWESELGDWDEREPAWFA